MKLPRRKLLHLAAGAAALPAVSRFARAQAYPTRPVTMVVPFAAGGTTDFAARAVSEHMSHTLGKQFIVENVPGAGGTIGSIRVMRAKADGYTILMGHQGTHAFSVSLYPNLAYKPDVDFEPIGMVVETPNFIVARNDFPPKDLRGIRCLCKSECRQAEYGARWRGFHHIYVRSLAQLFAGCEANHGTIQWRCVSHECANRRPRGLHVSWKRGSRSSDSGRDHKGICNWRH